MISASAVRVYRALADPDAVATWLPPEGMTGHVEKYDLKVGGAVRIELTYEDASGEPGKTTEATDVVAGRFTAVDPGVRIVQEVAFDSEDPGFDEPMSMTWELTAQGMSTLVVFRADNVPDAISADDHRRGLESSLANLADYVT